MAEAFFYAVVCGLALGIIYDLMRFLRLLFKDCFFVDFFFWIFSSFFVFSYLLVFSQGEIRTVYFIFILSGFILVYFTLGRFTKPLQKKIAEKIRIRCKSLKKQLQNTLNVLYNKLKVRNKTFWPKYKGDKNVEEKGQKN